MYPRLRELRKEHGMTQAQLAEKLGISRATYGNYERGVRPLTASCLVALVRLYRVSADEILGIVDQRA